jgi:hypothetical protein
MKPNTAELAAHLAQIDAESPGKETRAAHLIARDAEALASIARTLHRLAEQDCNTGLNAAQDRMRDRLAKNAAEIAQRYGLTARTHGDPRGFGLYLRGLPGNTWGGDESGFGVG